MHYQIIPFTTSHKMLGLCTRPIGVRNAMVDVVRLCSVGTTCDQCRHSLLKSRRFVDCASQSKQCCAAGLFPLPTQGLPFKHTNVWCPNSVNSDVGIADSDKDNVTKDLQSGVKILETSQSPPPLPPYQCCNIGLGSSKVLETRTQH